MATDNEITIEVEQSGPGAPDATRVDQLGPHAYGGARQPMFTQAGALSQLAASMGNAVKEKLAGAMAGLSHNSALSSAKENYEQHRAKLDTMSQERQALMAEREKHQRNTPEHAMAGAGLRASSEAFKKLSDATLDAKHKYDLELERDQQGRGGGLLTSTVRKVWWGGKGQPEDEEKAKREVSSQGARFANHLMTAIAAPLPGGHIFNALAHGTLQGATTGFSEMGGGLRGILLGAGKGLGYGAMGGLAALLGAGAVGSVVGSRRNESNARTLGQAGGNLGEAMRLGRGASLLDEEFMPLAGDLLRSQGSLTGFRRVARMETGFGLGGQAASLLGSMARSGNETNEKAAQDALTKVISSGTAQGLAQGRFGELLQGAVDLVSRQQAGVSVGAGGVGEFATAMGMLRGSGLKGGQGAQVINQLDQLLTGRGGGGLSQLFAMQGAGLGQKNFFQMQQQMELGAFGTGAGGLQGSGAQGIKDFIGRFRDMFPDNDSRRFIMREQTGLGMNAIQKLEDAFDQNDTSAIEKIMEDAKPLQEKAFTAMVNVGAGWRGFQLAVHRIEDVLGQILANTGLLKDVTEMLRFLTEMLSNLPGMPKDMRSKKQATAYNDYRNEVLGAYDQAIKLSRENMNTPDKANALAAEAAWYMDQSDRAHPGGSNVPFKRGSKLFDPGSGNFDKFLNELKKAKTEGEREEVFVKFDMIDPVAAIHMRTTIQKKTGQPAVVKTGGQH